MQCRRILSFSTFSLIAFAIIATDAESIGNEVHIYTNSSGKSIEVRDMKRTAGEFFQNCCSNEANFVCNCCATYIQQSLCANMNIDAPSLLLSFDLSYNNQPLISNAYSANSIPPFCFPLLAALPFPLPLNGCIQVHGLALQSNVFHSCANASVNFANFILFEQRLGCIDLPIYGNRKGAKAFSFSTSAGINYQ